MKKLIVDNDIQTLLQKIKDIDKKKTILLLFTGSKDKSGVSWCPDCNVAEPVLQKVFSDKKYSSDDFVFITVYVGDRNTWKHPQNPFRTHKDFKVKCVPTLINAKTSNRLEESQLLDEELVKMLLDD